MTPLPPLPQAVWDALPSEAQSLVEALRLQIQSLQAEIATLKARLDANSHNSSKPPSSDPPHLKRQPPKPASKRKRGGQPGHKRALRPLVPPEKLTGVVDCLPTACSCGATLTGRDPEPQRHQVAELPVVRPDVIEYRLHGLDCPHCQKTTRGVLPAGVPSGAFGPRLLATISLLTGAYRLSKRQVQAAFSDLLGLSISTGMVSKAERRAAEVTAAPVAEVAEAITRAPTLNVDETGWREARKRSWLWVAVARDMTLFRIDHHRSTAALRRLVGPKITPVLGSDRFAVYQAACRRQICWAHLRRDFQAMIDRQAGGEGVGAALLEHCGQLFAWWREFRGGRIRRSTLRKYLCWLRVVVRSELESGRAGPCCRTAKVCRQILKVEKWLWTFARVEGVSPDNNAAERALRHGVIWRRTSGGTDSVGGSRFVGQLLSVVATCRQRGRQVLGYLRECFAASFQGRPAPSLLS